MNNDWQRLLKNHPLTWSLPLAVLLISLAIFVFYQVAYAGEIEALQDRFESDSAARQELLAQRTELETYLERVRASRGGIRALYLDYFQTAAERQTAVLSEIQRLAKSAGLDPPSFSYPYEAVGDLDLHEMGIDFGVTGTYEQLRRFINLIELTAQFLTLREITLGSTAGGGGASPQLSITLSASTVFVTEALARRAAAARDAEAASHVDQIADPDSVSDDQEASDPREETADLGVTPPPTSDPEIEGPAGEAADPDAEDSTNP